jgi:hypothetical protein
MNVTTLIISAILTGCVVVILLAVTAEAELQPARTTTGYQDTVSGLDLQPAGRGTALQDTIKGTELQPAGENR